MSQINQLLISYGGLFLFAMAFVEQSGLPLPAAPWLLAEGALAADGKLRLFGAIGCAALGCLAADLIWFRLGLHGKGHIFRVFPDLESIKLTILPRPHTRLFFLGVRRLAAAKFQVITKSLFWGEENWGATPDPAPPPPPWLTFLCGFPQGVKQT
jgi:membrane protein DedA with SNARE-associated domain